jgi:hypothetical protein
MQLWNTTMSFIDIIPSNTGATANFSALYKKITPLTLTGNTETLVPLNTVVYGPPISPGNSYEITAQTILDALSLTFKSSNLFQINIPNYSGNFTITTKIYKNSILPSNLIGQANNTYNNNSLPPPLSLYFQSKEVNIPVSSLAVGDKYFSTVRISFSPPSSGTPTLKLDSSNFQVSQYPIYTPPVTSSGANSIWNWGDKLNYPYIITSSNVSLVTLYDDPNSRMADITGSGFNPIQLPWSIEYGDEFRFEGREDLVYQVGKVFGPGDSGSGRIFQTGSVEVHLNNNLPVSASTSAFNLDHFLIRRYIDDASLILMEGFKPINSSGPFIVRPEYVVPELDKSVDEFILDLTQKGLIP